MAHDGGPQVRPEAGTPGPVAEAGVAGWPSGAVAAASVPEWPAGPGDGGGPWTGPPVPPVAERDRLTRWVLRMHERAPGWVAPLAALGCMGAAAAYTLLSHPTSSPPDAAPTCLLKLTTGLDCPGCGGTRAMWYLLHGDVPAAARHHLLWVFVLPFLLYLYLTWALERSFGWRLPKLRISARTLGLMLIVWAVFSVVRNLPWAPFTALYV
ncbi:DUF2752 domain-containing protein [Plantactinospora siamensis]|uniref:DUF2752 domain-containing protein n=1 Tax=Plantactinospora siamensis TaxID=555372 RepID=A0ABV6NSP8_9ACTN